MHIADALVVFLHGMFTTDKVWKNWRKLFEALGYECYAPRLPCHETKFDENPDSTLATKGLQEYADHLLKKIQERAGDRPIVLIGWSMGGLLAQKLAATQRINVKALVLLGSAPPRSLVALRLLITPSVVKSFQSNLTTWRFWAKSGKQTFEEFQYSMANCLPSHEQKEYYKKLVWESGKAGFQIGFWFLDRTKASAVEKHHITCPVLVVGGTLDRIVPMFVARALAKRYQTPLVEFLMGHWYPAESGWETVATYCQEWIHATLDIQEPTLVPSL